MTFKKSHILPLVTSGFFFCLDQVFKWYAFAHQSFHAFLIDNTLGWEYFGNTGVAFSLPFPNTVLIVGTPILLILLLAYAGHKKDIPAQVFLGGSLIFFGALSNLIDRTLYALTIDYIRIFTAVINIGDIMIICGTLFLLLGHKETDTENQTEIT
jgi:lipoprotein signal peptidase